jgi:transcriptional regulator with XRE-family HTH domain
MNNGKGISLAHLARQTGVGRSFVTKLEKGTSQPGAELMLRMARYFKQTVEAIFQLVDGKKAKSAIACMDMIPDSQSIKPFFKSPPVKRAGNESTAAPGIASGTEAGKYNSLGKAAAQVAITPLKALLLGGNKGMKK